MQKITLYEEEFFKEEAKEESIQLIVFRLANEWYGIEISKTKEIVKVEKITYLPSSPPDIAGIVNVRGNILSVTDLKKTFGLPDEGLTETSRIVVIEAGTIETGLLVDEACGVIEVPLSKIDPALSTLPPERAEYVEGECKADSKLIGILKVEKILEKRQ